MPWSPCPGFGPSRPEPIGAGTARDSGRCAPMRARTDPSCPCPGLCRGTGPIPIARIWLLLNFRQRSRSDPPGRARRSANGPPNPILVPRDPCQNLFGIRGIQLAGLVYGVRISVPPWIWHPHPDPAGCVIPVGSMQSRHTSLRRVWLRFGKTGPGFWRACCRMPLIIPGCAVHVCP